MRIPIKLFGVCAALFALGMGGECLHAQRDRDQEAIEVGWLFDYNKAKDVAAETGKPLMVVFRCVP